MKNNKTNHIAVAYEQGKCVMLCVCKMADDNEVNKLINEVNAHKEAEAQEKQELKKEIESCKKKIEGLEEEVKLLKGED